MKVKKSLGQNFFINENLGNRIIEYVFSENPDVLVEIGPGTGFFTRKLAVKDIPLLLIEKDDTLAQHLKAEFPKAHVVNKDFLDWDFEELSMYENKEILFFGSLPYNASKPIIQKIITSNHFSNAYFIIQKEVAEKYTSLQSNILNLKSRLYANPKKILDISPGSFMPKPKVNSTYIKFTHTNKTFDFDKTAFVSFLEKCFRSPRKMLSNNLQGITTNNISNQLLTKRPADISMEEYIDIFISLSL